MSSLFNDNKSVEKNQYKISKFPQRRNSVYKLKLENAIICIFCEKKVKSSKGRTKKWRSLNSLHGHCSFEHFGENFIDWIIGLAQEIINGVRK